MAGRLFWAMLILIHIPALIGASRSLVDSPDLFHIASMIALIMTVGFFVLKLAGVKFLPHGNTRSRAIIFLLIAALVHIEATATAADNLIAGPVPAVFVVLIAANGVRRLRRHFRTLKRKLASLHASHISVAYLSGNAALVEVFKPLPTLAGHFRIPRAPPA